MPDDIPFADPTGAIDQLLVSRDIFAKLRQPKKQAIVKLAPSPTKAAIPIPQVKPAAKPQPSLKGKTDTVVLQFSDKSTNSDQRVRCYTHYNPNRKYEAWLQAYSSFTDNRELAAQKHTRHEDGKTVSGLNFLFNELGPREEWGDTNHTLNKKQKVQAINSKASRKSTGKKGLKQSHITPRNYNVETWTVDSSEQLSVEGFKTSLRPPTYVELLSDHWKCLRANNPPILGYTRDDIPDYEELLANVSKERSSVDHTGLMIAQYYRDHAAYVQDCQETSESLKDDDREEPTVVIKSVGKVGLVGPPNVEPLFFGGYSTQHTMYFGHSDWGVSKRFSKPLYVREGLVAFTGVGIGYPDAEPSHVEHLEDEQHENYCQDRQYLLWLSAPEMMYFLRQRDEEAVPLDPENTTDDGWCPVFAQGRELSEHDRYRMNNPELLLTKGTQVLREPIHESFRGSLVVNKINWANGRYSTKSYAKIYKAMRQASRERYAEPVIVQPARVMEQAVRNEDVALTKLTDKCTRKVLAGSNYTMVGSILVPNYVAKNSSHTCGECGAHKG